VRVSWKALAQEGSAGTFSLSLSSNERLDLPDGVTINVRPITLMDAFTQPMETAGKAASAAFQTVSFDALTSFFALELTLVVGEDRLSEDFVIRAELSGAPENRLARILDGMLSNPEAVLRFLRLLLAMDAFDVIKALGDEPLTSSSQKGGFGESAQAPLLESMLRALAREPSRLDAIDQLVSDLTKTEEGAKHLPPGFLAAWEPIRGARAVLGRKRS
jgi:hypothetical protein